MNENEISYKIIGAAIEVHKNTGPGLPEIIYEHALTYELKKLGLEVSQQIPQPFMYKGNKMGAGYTIDLVVNRKVLIDIRSLEVLSPVHHAQTLTYLKLSGLKMGLLINFNSDVLAEGVHRITNNPL